ncbi:MULTISPECIES: LysR substrate-binding domain-containing protein [unclassified Brevibacterium]|uniref:LysR substrate-binding domain-containing protein n=1 Tax=unclassified Brevibacterium TaxID=2614124 RepID=UPI0010F82441|nr:MULTISPECIES: LysR substrate-binding domain-containing protein [unclassified Brevibacterium]MCM1013371.1 LysR substrate-binding domain-containing protein [Brevibacterium sp. XM4083]
MIDPRLKSLAAVRDTGTVTAAAALLHVTPSTISQHLRGLARVVGADLVEPVGRNVRLTPAAEVVLAHATALNAEWEATLADLAALRSAGRARLRISAVASAIVALVCPAVARLPEIAVEIGEDAVRDRFRMLAESETDIVVTLEATLPDSAADSAGTTATTDDGGPWEVRELLTEPLDVIVEPGHPLAGNERVGLSALAAETWIGAGDLRDQKALFLRLCAQAGFTPHLRHDALDWGAIIALVEYGHGIALLPRTIRIAPESGVHRLELGWPDSHTVPHRRLRAYIRAGSASHPTIAAGLEALTAQGRRLADTGTV